MLLDEIFYPLLLPGMAHVSLCRLIGNLLLKYDRSDTIFNPNLQTSHLQSDFASKLIFFLSRECFLPDAEQVGMPRHGQLSSVQEV